MKVLHFAGPSDSGKTRLIEALLPRIPARLVVKWTHHALADDAWERDTGRFGASGIPTLLVGPNGLIDRRPLGDRQVLYQRLARECGENDLVVMEGDKGAPHPKIWLGPLPSPAVRIGWIIGPDRPPDGISWWPASIPLAGAAIDELADYLTHTWHQYVYLVPKESDA